MSKFILIGHPVAHSVSPEIHKAAYEALGVSHSYELVDCPDEASVQYQVELIRSGELGVANVTVPHKVLALTLADEVHESAAGVGAANTLACENGRVVAYNTDVLGLAYDLQLKTTKFPRYALVLGNGGAARAAVVACQRIGVRTVYLTARSFIGAPKLWPKCSEFRELGAVLLPWRTVGKSIVPRMETLDIVVQATSAGMKGVGEGENVAKRVPFHELPEEALAYDLVYNPPSTPFLETAYEESVEYCNGLGMLVGLAVETIKIWLGVEPDREVMLRAANKAICG